MTGKYEKKQGKSTLSFTYEKPDKDALLIEDTLENAASLLHIRGFGKNNSFDALSALTQQDKVNIVDAHVDSVIVNLAQQNIIDQRVAAARLDAASAGSKVDL